jgi:hypothetical protein
MRSGPPELEINDTWLVVASRETGYKDASGEVALEHHIICNDPRINEHISNTSTELSGFAPLLAEPPAKGFWFSWCRIIGSGVDEWAVEPLEQPWRPLNPFAAMTLALGAFTPAALKVQLVPSEKIAEAIRKWEREQARGASSEVV